MLTSFSDMKQRGLAFWDEAQPGDLCAVPCWPVDAQGNAYDCEDETVLVGVLGTDGLFRAEEAPAFDPKYFTYVCSRDEGPALVDCRVGVLGTYLTRILGET